VENLLKKVENSTVKQVARPTSGGIAGGNRPARYVYWRTGFGIPLPHPMEFWVQQAGEYHCRPHGVTGSYEYQAGSTHCFFQTEGTALLEVGSKAVLIRAGDLFMLPVNSQFSYRAQAGIKYHWFMLAGQWPAYISDQHRWLSVGQDTDLLDKFIELREVLILKPPGYASLAISIVFALLARLSAIARETRHPESEYPDTVRNALIFLRENYADTFDAAQTAATVGISQFVKLIVNSFCPSFPRAFSGNPPLLVWMPDKDTRA
jgi:mannose-6-phosphate isomerase-like protein (cupin superfamily)